MDAHRRETVQLSVATRQHGVSAHGVIDQALAAGPANAEVMFRVGHAYETLGEREKALVWIGRALENGYPKDEIQENPGLRELRKDVRYEVLLGNTRTEPGT